MRAEFNFQNIVVVSGCQSGVDRAALDAALSLGLSIGGWAPKGWGSEDGPIDRKYRYDQESGEGLREDRGPVSSLAHAYSRRTYLNVSESDATVIITRRPMSGGTKRAYEICQDERRPCLLIKTVLWKPGRAGDVVDWLRGKSATRVNFAGPRESKEEGIYDEAYGIVRAILELLHERYPA